MDESSVSFGMSDRALTALLAFLAATGALATSIYIPALPALTADLATDSGMVQLTMTVFLVVFAFAQLIYGPWSDARGRRGVIAAGLIVFAIGCAICAFAPSIEWLIVGRAVQAFGACAGPVVSRAIVRDAFDAKRAGAVMASIAIGLSVAPALGPFIGGSLHQFFGWRSIFLFLIAMTGLLLWAVVTLPETHPKDRHLPANPVAILAAFAALLRDAAFRRFALAGMAVFAGMFAYITGSPFLFINELGVSPQTYGALIMINVAGFMTGSMLANRLAQQGLVERAILIGGCMSALGGTALLSLAAGQALTIASTVAAMAVFQVGTGLVIPSSFAGALRAHPRLAGSASSLVGFVQMTGAAAMTFLVAKLDGPGHLVMTGFLAGAGVATLTLGVLLTRGLRAA